MSTAICYFSGTGNSLAVAKELAQGLRAAMVSMAAFVDRRSAATDADTIGLVFPAYRAHLDGIPLVVKRFVRRLEHLDSKYVFAICTCGGYENFNALPALKNLARLINSLGGKLSGEFSIRLPMNTLDYSHIPVPINQNCDRIFRNSDIKVQQICETVARRAKSRFRHTKDVLNSVMSPLYLILRSLYYKELQVKAMQPLERTSRYEELIPLTDRSIYADKNCAGCATCTKVCPVGNIVMRNDKPLWQHHCETCLACAEWCPNAAIHHGYRDTVNKYRHPHIGLADMVEQANRMP